jgi:hypothetical protein
VGSSLIVTELQLAPEASLDVIESGLSGWRLFTISEVFVLL